MARDQLRPTLLLVTPRATGKGMLASARPRLRGEEKGRMTVKASALC